MATKKLYNLEIDYGATITEADMVKLQKYSPSAKFHDMKYFIVPSYSKGDDKYKGWTEDQFKQHAEDEYTKYINKNPREFDIYTTSKGLNLIDLDAFLAEDINVAFKITGFTTITFTAPHQSFDLNEYKDIFQTLEGLRHQLQERDSFNSKCNVHIGGAHLMTINRTMLCEDCCTDKLQEHLNKGWRIIACCVQDSRRPDYVLGKYDLAFEANTDSAEVNMDKTKLEHLNNLARTIKDYENRVKFITNHQNANIVLKLNGESWEGLDEKDEEQRAYIVQAILCMLECKLNTLKKEFANG